MDTLSPEKEPQAHGREQHQNVTAVRRFPPGTRGSGSEPQYVPFGMTQLSRRSRGSLLEWASQGGARTALVRG